MFELFLAVVMLIHTRHAGEKCLENVWSFLGKDYLYLMQAKIDLNKKAS